MKRVIWLLAGLAVFLQPLTTWADPPAKKDFLIFLLIGQSNMAGRGKPLTEEDQKPHPRVLVLNKEQQWAPAVDPLHWDKPPVVGVGLGLTFGKTVADALPGKTIGLVPAAFGGSQISEWARGAKHYTNAVQRAQRALEDGTLAGVLWHQGESDTQPDRAALYQQRLDELVDNLRQDLASPGVPWVVGELAESQTSEGAAQVVKALRSLPERKPAITCVTTRGLKMARDGIHFDADSYRELGRRYAEAWLALAADSSKAAAKPVRIGDAVGGHIHPAVCITMKGTIVVTYGRVNHRDLRITRSTDGGQTWEEPAPFVHTVGKTYYPGSLTTLADGRIVHAWNRWDTDTTEKEPRSVLYSISADEGKTWSEPSPFPRSLDKRSVIRHPLVELSPDQWLVSLDDRTFVFNPQTQSHTPFGDGRVHGLVPIVRTPRGTFISGRGLRSTDEGRTWQPIENFPDIATQGWRHELVCLSNGWLLASEILGPGFGGERIRYRISRDDGLTWAETYEYYNPGRAIGGRACPRTIQLDDETIGVVFYDVDANQPGGPGVFFFRMPLAKLVGQRSEKS